MVYAYSAMASAPVVVLNVQSYPALGGLWTVEFATSGSAGLPIAPANDGCVSFDGVMVL